MYVIDNVTLFQLFPFLSDDLVRVLKLPFVYFSHPLKLLQCVKGIFSNVLSWHVIARKFVDTITHLSYSL